MISSGTSLFHQYQVCTSTVRLEVQLTDAWVLGAQILASTLLNLSLSLQC